MPESFDPYRDWLGLAVPGKPENYYSLLNLPALTSEPAAIEAAASRMLARLVVQQTTGHPDWQNVHREVSAAKKCLTDADAKRRYDEALRARLATQPKQLPRSADMLPPGMSVAVDQSAMTSPASIALTSFASSSQDVAAAQLHPPALRPKTMPVSSDLLPPDFTAANTTPSTRPAAGGLAADAELAMMSNSQPTASSIGPSFVDVDDFLPPSFRDGSDVPPDPAALLGNLPPPARPSVSSPGFGPPPASPPGPPSPPPFPPGPPAYTSPNVALPQFHATIVPPPPYSAPFAAYAPASLPASQPPAVPFAPAPVNDFASSAAAFLTPSTAAPAAVGFPQISALPAAIAMPAGMDGPDDGPARQRRRRATGNGTSQTMLFVGVAGGVALLVLVVGGIVFMASGNRDADALAQSSGPAAAHSSATTKTSEPVKTPVKPENKLHSGQKPMAPPATHVAEVPTPPSPTKVKPEPRKPDVVAKPDIKPSPTMQPDPMNDVASVGPMKPAVNPEEMPIKPDMTKPEDVKPAEPVMPAPSKPKLPKVPTIDPQKSAQLKTLLADVRKQLGMRNIDEAEKMIATAAKLAQTPEQETMVNRHDNLRKYVFGFWGAVGDRLKVLKPTDTFKIGSTEVIVIDQSPESLSIRMNGQRRNFTLKDMPPGLAVALAKDQFDPKQPTNKVFMGAFMLVEPTGGVEEAKRFWDEAALAGVDTRFLVPLLNPDDAFSPTTTPTDRRSLPLAADLVAAEKAFHDQYDDTIAAARLPVKKADLAQKLIDVAQSAGDDFAKRYVLLREARNLFAQANQADKMLDVVDELGRWFTVDGIKMKADTMASWPGSTAAGAKLVATISLKLMGEAEVNKRLEVAETLSNVATAAAKKSASTDLVKLAKEKKDELQKLKSAGS